MKFSAKQEKLKEELGFVQGIVEKRSTIPVLSCILIESEGKDKIKITGTDLDTTLVTIIEAEVKEEGSVCVPARKLFDIVRLLEKEEVSFTYDGSRVEIESGKANFRLLSYNEDNFPQIPSAKALDMAEVENAIISSFIQMTGFAMTQDMIRYALSGAKFESRDGRLRMVTTDGHRLALVEKEMTSAPFDVLIPKKAINELSRLTKEKGQCRFAEDENLLYFEIGSRKLIARKLTGIFPNYEAVIPKESHFVAEFDGIEMKNALRRVSVMADERSRAVKLTLSDGKIEIEAESSEEGMAREEVVADYKGETVTIGFNFQYLQDFLNVISAESVATVEKETEGEKVRAKTNSVNVRFEFRDNFSQVVMKPVKDSEYSYLYVVMPLRIS
ncbi:MAG: DNA polymerase III subunit beta [Pyrinomonadaceae bacterium]|nr:DNA polymerase III subunit beta [Pyrinomonadaceae bacterium]MCX7639125.1 DNA polymerase III subunit beta [Pyrinomonadaceae bacterium]MDW8303654.1 DNA polymerase III subunit beta [Acidobacteriota bacterium]